ncbi:vasoactive intestinal polypeptide receptor 1b isoform X1 [Dunckerocampus dactyliophorus]|uniref:vasoactive intestinal polypeptide receptor 1b isoform X1 n=1 Tax=Dunckerocampus dactyliophorus TaxID=161453 RepID=UPI0024072E6A|nr:vasoactive intestinal polypeptide receptor 1b isoform X1 [Dunckerocampus dactyliophorus]
MDASLMLLVLMLHGWHLPQVLSLQMCDIMSEIELERERCENSTSGNVTSGCQGMWDIVACWPSAHVGEVVTISCPTYFSYFSDQHKGRAINHGFLAWQMVYLWRLQGNLSKMCTADGWAEMHPVDIALNCGYNVNSTSDDGKFFWQVKIGYTIGHSVSLISLTTAITILCIFRKLHCTRNYIHMHLFVSFILKAIAVFIKDVVLYEVGEVDNCSSGSVGCKAVMVFFQYGIMASFFWLLVEGLYLHALLAVSFFSEKKYFWAYILIGWGGPAIFITAWSVAKAYYNDIGCWDIIETTDVFWWIIKTPILASILMNFILFICIIRILRQKINCPDIGRNESNQYSRLAKSTLLLIPLFGINFIVFAFIPEQVKTELRLIFDLILGSFQGFVVAVLYCFLNGEVQGEMKRKWRRWHLQRYMGADSKYQQPSIGSSNNFSTQISMLTRCSPKTRRASSSGHDDLSCI